MGFWKRTFLPVTPQGGKDPSLVVILSRVESVILLKSLEITVYLSLARREAIQGKS